MSTSFNGDYCPQKDKMKLGRTEAAAIAKRMMGMRTYKCDVCGGWHLTHEKRRRGMGFNKRLLKKGKPGRKPTT